MSVKLPGNFKVEPTPQEKSASAARVTIYSTIGNVLVLIVSQILNLKGRGSDRALLVLAFVMMFLSAVCLGSGVFAIQSLKKRKAQIIALILICIAATVIYIKKNFL